MPRIWQVYRYPVGGGRRQQAMKAAAGAVSTHLAARGRIAPTTSGDLPLWICPCYTSSPVADFEQVKVSTINHISIIIINEFHCDASLTKTSGPLCVTCFTSVNGTVAGSVRCRMIYGTVPSSVHA